MSKDDYICTSQCSNLVVPTSAIRTCSKSVYVSYGLSLGWQHLSINLTHMFNTPKTFMLSSVHLSYESQTFNRLYPTPTNSCGLLINIFNMIHNYCYRYRKGMQTKCLQLCGCTRHAIVFLVWQIEVTLFSQS